MKRKGHYNRSSKDFNLYSKNFHRKYDSKYQPSGITWRKSFSIKKIFGIKD